MRITFEYQKILLLVMCILLIVSCDTSSIVKDETVDGPVGARSINLSVNVPKRSVSSYSGVDGSFDENHIDTLYVNIFENGVLKEFRKFYDLVAEGGSNDSIVKLAFETESLSGGGTVTAEIFANRMEIVPITREIPLPDRTKVDSCFMMSGSGTLSYSDGAYNGVIHIVRNVAKLRVRISRHPAIIPSNLVILYDQLAIEAQQVPDRTQLLPPPPILSPSGLTYINYAPRSGTDLRSESPVATFTGGQIDSLYLNENYLDDAGYTDVNRRTRIKVTLPTQAPGMPVKTEEYTYQLFTEGSYRIKRNYIYTLDIRVAGQTLEPFVTVDMQPWNDVPVNGDINGVSLTLDKFEVSLAPANTKDNPGTVGYYTDNTSVRLDWSKIDPSHNIDTSVSGIQGMTGEIKIYWTGSGAPNYDFRDTLYVITQNIMKAVVLDYKVKGAFGNWVGTFHRWNQRGERIIKMQNQGTWTATVTQGDDFIVLDGSGTGDANWGTSSAALGNDALFDLLYPVNGTSTSVSGNGIVYFRVGMKSTLPYIGAPPRYGVIEVVTAGGTKTIYVRQGEEADYVMRPEDANPSNGNQLRPYAMKFSPYNLADPLRGTDQQMPYGDVVFNSSKFADYPSQAGYFFPWNSSGWAAAQQGYNRAYHPVNPIGAIPSMLYIANPVTWNRALEACPVGYRHPNDSLQSPAMSEIRQSWFYTPNSNLDTELSQPGGNLDNSLWGFYADGFFDRQTIVSSPNGVDSTAVSFYSSDIADARNTGVAYAGRLLYNPINKASLFLPAAGARNGGSSIGPLLGSGQTGIYWTSTNNSPVYASAWAIAYRFTRDAFYGFCSEEGSLVPSGMSIRCVKDDFGLPGSM
jgi:hypothetical protein